MFVLRSFCSTALRSADTVQQEAKARRQDKHASKQQIIDPLDQANGCISVLLHLSRTGGSTIRLSPTLQQHYNCCQLREQIRIDSQYQVAARVLNQLQDGRNAAARSQERQPASTNQSSAGAALQHDNAEGDMSEAAREEQHANQIIMPRLTGPATQVFSTRVAPGLHPGTPKGIKAFLIYS